MIFYFNCQDLADNCYGGDKNTSSLRSMAYLKLTPWLLPFITALNKRHVLSAVFPFFIVHLPKGVRATQSLHNP